MIPEVTRIEQSHLRGEGAKSQEKVVNMDHDGVTFFNLRKLVNEALLVTVGKISCF